MSRTKSPLLGKSDHFVRDIIHFWSIWWPPKHIIHFESITKVRLRLITSKKERLNRSQRPKLRFVWFQQRTVTNYIEKEKTEPFQASFRFIPTENCDSLRRKRKDWTVSEDPRLISFHPNRELWLITSKKKRMNRSQRPKPFVSFQQSKV